MGPARAFPSLLAAPRSTPWVTWSWMRWDLPGRVVPILGGTLLAAALTPIPLRTLGVTLDGLGVQLLLAAPLAPAMGCLAWWYRRRFVRGVVVPTDLDHWCQSLYYVVVNAPVEELFFRGLLLGWLRGRVGAPAAWALSTAVFGLYHVPARWGWCSVAGVTFAGGAFGLLFLVGPGRGSLVLPTLVHAAATCGFLSTGAWLAYRREARRARKAEAARA